MFVYVCADQSTKWHGTLTHQIHHEIQFNTFRIICIVTNVSICQYNFQTLYDWSDWNGWGKKIKINQWCFLLCISSIEIKIILRDFFIWFAMFLFILAYVNSILISILWITMIELPWISKQANKQMYRYTHTQHSYLLTRFKRMIVILGISNYGGGGEHIAFSAPFFWDFWAIDISIQVNRAFWTLINLRRQKN